MSQIPQNWVSTELHEICSVIRGITFPASSKETTLTADNVCCLRTTNIQREIDWTDVYFVPRSFVKREDQIVQPGDILMSMANSYELVGKVAVARNIPCVTAFGAFLSAVRPRKGLDGQFLFHLLRTDAVQSELRKGSSQTVNIANISVSTLGTVPIVFAPYKEQKRIADKLDALLARVDKCRERLDRIPAILKRFRETVLAAATSGTLTEEWREGKVRSNDWSHSTIGSVVVDIRYGTAKKCRYEPKATPVLRIPNVVGGQVNHDDLKYAEFEPGELRKLALEVGDILMIRSNGSVGLVGRTAVVTEQERGFAYAGYLVRLKVKQSIARPAYVALSLMSSKSRNSIELVARSTSGVNNINSDEIKALKISIPGIDEQDEIIRRVEILFAYADNLEARYAAGRAQVERLTSALLAKAFRGELVQQDPGDEPASVLLERIRIARALISKPQTRQKTN